MLILGSLYANIVRKQTQVMFDIEGANAILSMCVKSHNKCFIIKSRFSWSVTMIMKNGKQHAKRKSSLVKKILATPSHLTVCQKAFAIVKTHACLDFGDIDIIFKGPNGLDC